MFLVNKMLRCYDMPNPLGNPAFKNKYGEPTKVVRLPESLAEKALQLLNEGVTHEKILAELECLPVVQRTVLPEVSAVYLVHESDRLLYIGRAKNLRQRIATHHRLKQFEGTSISWIPCDENDLAGLEEQLIEILDPALNNSPVIGGKKLFSFRWDEDELAEFSARCEEQGISANAKLGELLREYLGKPTGTDSTDSVPDSRELDAIKFEINAINSRVDELYRLIAEKGVSDSNVVKLVA